MENEYIMLSAATLKDIMNKLPPEKWSECIDEMKSLLTQYQQISAIVEFSALQHGLQLSDALQFPDEINWVDDRKQENTFTFQATDPDGNVADTASIVLKQENK